MTAPMTAPLTRRTLLLGLAAAPGAARAQDGFPSRAITLFAPVAPGGPADVMGRPLGTALTADWGQPVVMDHRPGAGGTIGMEAASRARPDGHALVIVSNSTYAIAPHLYPMPYDTDAAFVPVALIAAAPSFLVVHRSVPATSVAELVALAKAQPDRLAYATAGIGFTSHLATELFMSLTGTAMLHVPYRGGAPATQAMLSGEAQVNFMEAAFVRAHAPGGAIRPLAVTTRTRHPLFPDIPTIEEAGVPGFESATYWAVLAPAGTPPAVLARVAEAVLRWARAEPTRAMLTAAGFLPLGGDAEAFRRHRAEDTAKWGRIIRERGIRIS
ncbi:MAG: tripartite tricarboxylate transporter substrate binding protein [Acetobacteraceae bacterium]|nr:tripartite tricarboxylate transporter substrate binding protein [Acetobacteraceae bacterium]